jgi:hypothetical protein
MILGPAKPFSMLRMDARREILASSKQLVEVPDREKMGMEKRVTVEIIRAVIEKKLC